MDSSLQELIESHGILVIDDLSSYLKNDSKSYLLKAASKQGIHSYLIGLILFSCRWKDIYTESYEELSQQIAIHLALVIEKTTLYRGIKLNKQLIEK